MNAIGMHFEASFSQQNVGAIFVVGAGVGAAVVAENNTVNRIKIMNSIILSFHNEKNTSQGQNRFMITLLHRRLCL